MTDNLYEALEVCIKALETGADIEAVLKLYPHMTDDLRPILETIQHAQSLSAPAVPDAAVRRGRARVLQHAAEMRESARKPRKSRFVFRRLATSLALTFALLFGGTGIVNASSGAIPGDHLYPVKRTWEDVRLLFEFSPAGREELESAYEQERLNEIDELLVEGREETIAFYGIVTAQDGDYWLVSGVPVQIIATTQVPAEAIFIGAPVTVVGHTNPQGFIEAKMIGALDSGVSLPPLEPNELETGNEGGEHGEQSEQGKISLTPQVQGIGDATPQVGDIGINTPEAPRTFEFRGVVSSKKDGIWIINGQQVKVSETIVIGDIKVGAFVKLEGYYGPSGDFVATKIELRSASNKDSGSSESTNDSSSGDSSSGDSDDESHDD